MELTLIYGREGSGKSTLVHKICAEKNKSKIIFIVPDQYTHQTELELIAAYKSSGLIETEVLSFKRLSHRLKLLYGGASVISLSDEGKAMLINRIISGINKDGNDTLFGNNAKTNICSDISKLISRFKQYGITPQMIESCSVDEDKYSHTKQKLLEIAEIYKQYTELPENDDGYSFIDEDDETLLLCRNIQQSGFLADKDVFIDGFDDFVKLDLDVIEALILTAKSVTITLPTDYAVTNGRRLLFKRQISALRAVETLAEKCGIIPKKIWLTDDTDAYSPEIEIRQMQENRVKAISYLEKNIFGLPKKCELNNADGLFLVKENNILSETEHVSDFIVRLVRDKGYRYNEIAVVCSDIEKYQSPLKKSFVRRKIPFFMDTKRSIRNNTIVRFILGLLDAAALHFNTNAVISFLKTGMLTEGFDKNENLPFSYMDIAYIEKYCAQYYIQGKAWETDFKYGAEYFDIERLNTIRAKVMYYIKPFEDAVKSAVTASDITRAIENYISDMNIHEIVNQSIEDLRSADKSDTALEYSNIWNVLSSILTQINMFMGDVEISVEDYAELIGNCIDGITINVIPATLDQVSVLGVGRTMAKHVRALLVLGADGISFTDDSSIFNMTELDMLKALDIYIGADSETSICDERYYIYKMLSKPTDCLYISTTDAQTLSENVNPILINAVKNVFNGVLKETRNAPVPYALNEIDNIGSAQSAMLYEMTTLEEKSDSYRKLNNWLKNNSDFKYNILSEVVDKGKNYSLITEKADTEHMIKTHNGEYSIDISRLEKYIRCPYAYFVRYCLNPKPEIYGKVSALDVGNIVHEMLDLFTKSVMSCKEPRKSDVDKFMSENFDKVVASYETGKFSAMDENKYVLKRVKNFLEQMMYVMAEQKCRSSTVLFATELVFDDNCKNKTALPSIECISADGIKFDIMGKIDCVEYCDTDNGRYWIISDYKTGRNPSNSDIINGKSLQLPIYMFAVLKNDENALPGAMFYVNVNDDLSRNENENVASFIKKRYGKVGIISENEDLFRGIDNNCLKDSNGNVYDIKLSDTIADIKKIDILEHDEIQNVISDARKTAGEIFSDIMNGYIVKAPASKKECTYCDYRRFCGYDPRLKNSDERRIKTKNTAEEE